MDVGRLVEDGLLILVVVGVKFTAELLNNKEGLFLKLVVDAVVEVVVSGHCFK